MVSAQSDVFRVLLVLNNHLPEQTELLWTCAQLRICADGGANRLHQMMLHESIPPDFIIGDLDSVDASIKDFYSSKGTKIVDLSGDQDTTDLHKCVAFVCQSLPAAHNLQLIVLGALGGRFDHEMGNLNVLYRFRDTQIVLLNDDNLIFLLPRGSRHVLSAKLGAHCGLVPVGAPSKCTTTTGLRWNLSSTPMAFGSLISTSNVVEEKVVTVVSDVDLLWTMEIKDATGGASQQQLLDWTKRSN